jgi:hypothetical protein
MIGLVYGISATELILAPFIPSNTACGDLQGQEGWKYES